MKKLALATTALISLGAAATGARAEPAQLSVSGQISLAYSVVDQDSSAANTDGTDGAGLASGNPSTQLIFDWAGVTDGGMTYGARLDYRFQSDTADEMYIYLQDSWGRLVFGGDDGVVDDTVPSGEDVMAGDAGYDGDHIAHTAIGNAAIAPGLANDTDDNMKISYYTPTFSGFTLGASYIPNVNATTDTTGSGVINTQNGAARGDSPQFEGVIDYAGTFSGVGVAVGLGYALQEGGDGFEDATGLKAGATVSYADFALGVGYADNGDTGCAQGASCDAGGYWNVGLGYTFGPGAVSVGYMESESSLDGQKDEAEGLYFDADYRLADGLQVFGGVKLIEDKDASANIENDSTQFLMGTRVSF